MTSFKNSMVSNLLPGQMSDTPLSPCIGTHTCHTRLSVAVEKEGPRTLKT